MSEDGGDPNPIPEESIVFLYNGRSCEKKDPGINVVCAKGVTSPWFTGQDSDLLMVKVSLTSLVEVEGMLLLVFKDLDFFVHSGDLDFVVEMYPTFAT